MTCLFHKTINDLTERTECETWLLEDVFETVNQQIAVEREISPSPPNTGRSLGCVEHKMRDFIYEIVYLAW